MESKYFYDIEEYLDNTLPKSHKIDFEKQIKSDTELRLAVYKHRNHRKVLNTELKYTLAQQKVARKIYTNNDATARQQKLLILRRSMCKIVCRIAIWMCAAVAVMVILMGLNAPMV